MFFTRVPEQFQNIIRCKNEKRRNNDVPLMFQLLLASWFALNLKNRVRGWWQLFSVPVRTSLSDSEKSKNIHQSLHMPGVSMAVVKVKIQHFDPLW